MRELNYGENLQVGDKVKIGDKWNTVYKVIDKRGIALVKRNVMCTLELPITYSEEFKFSEDPYDDTYEVYRSLVD